MSVRSVFLPLLFLLLTSCANEKEVSIVSLVVSNPTQQDAIGVVDGISLRAILDSLGAEQGTPLTVIDERGVPICTQVFNNGQEDLLLFESSTLANGESTYIVRIGQPDTVFAPSVFVNQYPRRKDDLTWENESSIWRAYGPAIRNLEEHVFGYDIWCKNTRQLVSEMKYNTYFEGVKEADSLRNLDLQNAADSVIQVKGLDRDHGNGLDIYSVGPTLGGGTNALFPNGHIAYPWNYRTHKILANGPLLTAFELTFDSTYVAGDTLVEHRTVVAQKGTRFNIINVSYEGLRDSIPIVVGIVFHGDPDSTRVSIKDKYICYSDPSDKSDSADGRILIGIYAPSLKQTSLEQGHLLAISDYSAGKLFTYYLGSGWSKGDCPSLDAMEKELKTMKEQPRSVRIVMK